MERPYVLVPRHDPRFVQPLALVAGILVGTLVPRAGVVLWLILAVATLSMPLRTWNSLRRSLILLLLYAAVGLGRGILDVYPADSPTMGGVVGRIRAVHPTSWTVCPSHGSCIWVRLPRNHTLLAHRSDKVYVEGDIVAPQPPSNPFDVDERDIARARGSKWMMDTPTRILIVHPRESPIHAAAAYLVRARQQVAYRVDHVMLTDRSRAILKALLLGDRTGLDQVMQQAFVRSGLVHVLAVSGLHIGIVALLLLIAVRIPLRRLNIPEGRRRLLGAVLTAVGLVLFAAWVGASTSVVRATIMGCWMLAAHAASRGHTPSMALAWAAALALFVSPDAWQSAGFALSHAAVAAILLYIQRLSTLRNHPVRSSLLATTAATLGTAPVLMYHMGMVPLAGWVLGPLVIPLMGPVVLFGMAAMTTALPVPVLLAEAALFVLRVAAQWGASWPGWTHVHAVPGVVSPFMLIPWLILFATAPASPRTHTRRSTMCLIVVSIVLFMPRRDSFPVYAQLDVGQGDAAVIIVRNGPTVVVDTGPSDWSGGSILRHIRAAGRHHIDVLIHSHEHADHTGGTPFLVRNMPVRRILGQDDLVRGDTIHAGPGLRMYVLGPSPMTKGRNERSVILRMDHAGGSMLFTGDTEAAGERMLSHFMGPLLGTDVVKVPHHGSRTSSTRSFLERVSPQVAIVSVGRKNRYGHPDDAVLSAWTKHAYHVHITARSGAWTSLHQ